MSQVPIELSPPPPTREWGGGIAQLILNIQSDVAFAGV